MKYVVVKRKGAEILIAYPVVFPDALNHCDMVPEGFEAISAGEVDIDMDNKLIECWGKSESLKVKSNPKDAGHIENWILNGESLLVMMSAVYDPPTKKKSGRGKEKG